MYRVQDFCNNNHPVIFESWHVTDMWKTLA